MTAVDYSFEDVPKTLEAGETTFVLTNEGGVAHEMAFGLMRPGVSIEEALAPGNSNAIDPASRRVITSIEPGASGEVSIDLERGRYGYVCFLGEGTNDKPHALEGMLGEFAVE